MAGLKHIRHSAKTTQSFACLYCLDRRIFNTTEELWKHATELHRNELPADETDWERFRANFEVESGLKRSVSYAFHDGAYCAALWGRQARRPVTRRKGYHDTQFVEGKTNKWHC